MTEKELRHLSRTDMLSIIRDQEAELAAAKERAAELEQQLEDRRIKIEPCGTLAEASMQLSGIFSAAQLAADHYLSNIKEREGQIDERIERMEAEAEKRIQLKLQHTEAVCRAREAETQKKVNAYWAQLQVLLDQYYASHEGLKAMLSSSGIKITIPEPGAPAQADLPGTEKGLTGYEGTTYRATHPRAAGPGAPAQEA